MTQGEVPIPRHAARAILIDDANRVLLVRFEDADTGETWWGTPGGGLEPGETHEEAARREIGEETGLEGVVLGPWIWSREHVFRVGGTLYHQYERYFVVRVPTFNPRTVRLEPDEARWFRDLRWWSSTELASATVTTAPRDLPALLRDLMEQGPPREPRSVGI